jgi:hypothetical protein
LREEKESAPILAYAIKATLRRDSFLADFLGRTNQVKDEENVSLVFLVN